MRPSARIPVSPPHPPEITLRYIAHKHPSYLPAGWLASHGAQLEPGRKPTAGGACSGSRDPGETPQTRARTCERQSPYSSPDPEKEVA